MRGSRVLRVLALSLLSVLALVASAALAADSPPAKVTDLAWMTGTWAGSTGRGSLEENWTTPESGSIASLVRAFDGTTTSMIELITISEEQGSLVLRLQQWNPGWVARTPGPQVMRLVESVPNKVVFEATGEGALKRLGYSRPADDRFVISVETAQGPFEIPLTTKPR